MTDLDAIRARHVPLYGGRPDPFLKEVCRACLQPWWPDGCDTAIVLATLDELLTLTKASNQRARDYERMYFAAITDDPRLDALRRLADKSTGEWAFEADSEGLQLTVGDDRHTFITPEAAWTDQDWADAAFLTAAANYVRAALATTESPIR